jgi:formyl-CoA transferase
VADPQFESREMIVAVEDARLDRPLLVPGITPKLSRTPGHVPPLAPPLGADTAAVRASLGLDPSDPSAAEPVIAGRAAVLSRGSRG